MLSYAFGACMDIRQHWRKRYNSKTLVARFWKFYHTIHHTIVCDITNFQNMGTFLTWHHYDFTCMFNKLNKSFQQYQPDVMQDFQC